MSKKVVYIVGAGATQAEADHKSGEPVNLLLYTMVKSNLPGIAQKALSKSQVGEKLDINGDVDIEKLMSLLSSTGAADNMKHVENLRKQYHKLLTDGMEEAGISSAPELAIGLMQFHKLKEIMKIESLKGFISLNHDNLLQVASQAVHKGINLGFKFLTEGQHFKQKLNAPLINQMHGAFNWRKELDISVINIVEDRTYSDKMLWIPPSVSKEAREYPFNKLLGIGYEMLKDCEIVRIVGCSLSQNDWNLISLLFDTQQRQRNVNGDCFKIELIISHDLGEKIIANYSYLRNMVPIGNLREGDFEAYKLPVAERPEISALDNPFKYWLRQKLVYHINTHGIKQVALTKELKKIIEELP